MYSEQVAEDIKKILDDFGFEFEFDEEDSSFFVDLRLDKFRLNGLFYIKLSEQLVNVFMKTDLSANESNKLRVAEYLHWVNYYNERGNFEFDFDEGVIYYKCTLMMPDIHPTIEMLQETILMAYAGYTENIVGLKKVMAGTISPKEAVGLTEHEEEEQQQDGASVTTFVFADGSEMDAYFFENGRFGGLSRRRTGDEDEGKEYEEDDSDDDEEEELSWQLNLMGEWMQGRERKEFTGGSFAFLRYNPYSESLFESLAEEDSVVKLLQTMGMESRGHGNQNPKSWGGYRGLPTFIKEGLDNKIIGFLLYLQSHFDFYTEEDDYEEDCYLGDLEEFMPEARFIAGWSALPPYQDEAYAIVAL